MSYLVPPDGLVGAPDFPVPARARSTCRECSSPAVAGSLRVKGAALRFQLYVAADSQGPKPKPRSSQTLQPFVPRCRVVPFSYQSYHSPRKCRRNEGRVKESLFFRIIYQKSQKRQGDNRHFDRRTVREER